MDAGMMNADIVAGTGVGAAGAAGVGNGNGSVSMIALLIAIGVVVGIGVAVVIVTLITQVWLSWRAQRQSTEIWESHKAWGATLEQSQQSLTTAITAIHGDDLKLASRQATAAANRIEHAALGFAELAKTMLEGGEVGSGYGTDLGMDTGDENEHDPGVGEDSAAGSSRRYMSIPHPTPFPYRAASASASMSASSPIYPPTATAPRMPDGSSYISQSRVAQGDAAEQRLQQGMGVMGLDVDTGIADGIGTGLGADIDAGVDAGAGRSIEDAIRAAQNKPVEDDHGERNNFAGGDEQ